MATAEMRYSYTRFARGNRPNDNKFDIPYGLRPEIDKTNKKPEEEPVKLPKIILKDRLGNQLNTFTTLQEAIYRAEANIQKSRIGATALEWRLPHGPLPSKPDYSRCGPVVSTYRQKLKNLRKRNQALSKSLPNFPTKEIDVDDVAFVAESLNHLPNVPSLSFLRQEFLAEPKRYFPIVHSILLHQKYLTETDKRDREYHFPGFCFGCRRHMLCPGCDRSSQPHYHLNHLYKTTGGIFQTTALQDELRKQYGANWNLHLPDLFVRNTSKVPSLTREEMQLIEEELDKTLGSDSEQPTPGMTKLPAIPSAFRDGDDVQNNHSTTHQSEDTEDEGILVDRQSLGLNDEDAHTISSRDQDRGQMGSVDQSSDFDHDQDSEIEGHERSRKWQNRSSGRQSYTTTTGSGMEVDDDDAMSGYTSSQKREKKARLYKAPPAFRVKQRKKRVIKSQSPFSTERQLNIPKGPGFKVKPSSKEATKFMDFEKKDVTWKEPSKFEVKRSDRDTTKFWSPRSVKKHKNDKHGRHSSPDSGLDSDKMTESDSEEIPGCSHGNQNQKSKQEVPMEFSQLSIGSRDSEDDLPMTVDNDIEPLTSVEPSLDASINDIKEADNVAFLVDDISSINVQRKSSKMKHVKEEHKGHDGRVNDLEIHLGEESKPRDQVMEKNAVRVREMFSQDSNYLKDVYRTNEDTDIQNCYSNKSIITNNMAYQNNLCFIENGSKDKQPLDHSYFEGYSSHHKGNKIIGHQRRYISQDSGVQIQKEIEQRRKYEIENSDDNDSVHEHDLDKNGNISPSYLESELPGYIESLQSTDGDVYASGECIQRMNVNIGNIHRKMNHPLSEEKGGQMAVGNHLKSGALVRKGFHTCDKLTEEYKESKEIGNGNPIVMVTNGRLTTPMEATNHTETAEKNYSREPLNGNHILSEFEDDGSGIGERDETQNLASFPSMTDDEPKDAYQSNDQLSNKNTEEICGSPSKELTNINSECDNSSENVRESFTYGGTENCTIKGLDSSKSENIHENSSVIDLENSDFNFDGNKDCSVTEESEIGVDTMSRKLSEDIDDLIKNKLAELLAQLKSDHTLNRKKNVRKKKEKTKNVRRPGCQNRKYLYTAEGANKKRGILRLEDIAETKEKNKSFTDADEFQNDDEEVFTFISTVRFDPEFVDKSVNDHLQQTGGQHAQSLPDKSEDNLKLVSRTVSETELAIPEEEKSIQPDFPIVELQDKKLSCTSYPSDYGPQRSKDLRNYPVSGAVLDLQGKEKSALIQISESQLKNSISHDKEESLKNITQNACANNDSVIINVISQNSNSSILSESDPGAQKTSLHFEELENLVKGESELEINTHNASGDPDIKDWTGSEYSGFLTGTPAELVESFVNEDCKTYLTPNSLNLVEDNTHNATLQEVTLDLGCKSPSFKLHIRSFGDSSKGDNQDTMPPAPSSGKPKLQPVSTPSSQRITTELESSPLSSPLSLAPEVLTWSKVVTPLAQPQITERPPPVKKEKVKKVRREVKDNERSEKRRLGSEDRTESNDFSQISQIDKEEQAEVPLTNGVGEITLTNGFDSGHRDSPDLPQIEIPPLPEYKEVEKEVRIKEDRRTLIKEIPKLKESSSLPPPPPTKKPLKKIPHILPKKKGRVASAEAPVTQEELSEMTDPLDFLTKYCIIHMDRLPFYERIFSNIVETQTPRYERVQPLSPRTGMPLPQKEMPQWGKHELKMFRDLVVISRGQDHEKIGLSPPEQYLEKICFTLEILTEKRKEICSSLGKLESSKVQKLAERAKEVIKDIIKPNYVAKEPKKGKKKKKKKGQVEEPMETPVQLTMADITDEIIVSRIDEKTMKMLCKEADICQIDLEMERCNEKLMNIEERMMNLDGEKNILGMYCMEVYFLEQLNNQKPVNFRRAQSALYNKIHPHPDIEMNMDELEGSLQIINNNLLSSREYEYLFHILNLPGRRKINFKLFSIIAALSEKVTQMDPVVRKLINKMDYHALDHKMNRSRDLFALICDGEPTPRGNAPASNLAVELTAGGLTPEHIKVVLSKFNRDGTGYIDFMDFVMYIPLFIEIHERIVNNPLKVMFEV